MSNTSGAKASIWQERVTIPTYEVGPAEVNPIFYSGRVYQGAQGPIYPYPMLDRLSDHPTDRTYQAIHLENDFLKVTVLPEIGGRIFAAQDKTNGYDFIYRQHVIKPALIGMLGAWISGGAEWNIPHHHRPTTFLPVDHVVQEHPDGHKTLWVGETELRHRMRWLVGLSVYPDRSYIEVTTRVFNRTGLVNSFLCFANLAVHVNEDYQVIFPPSTQFGTQHAKCEFIHWPQARGLYGGHDFAGVDVSWWKNHPVPISIFACNEDAEFFGGYDHGRAAGTVHVADRFTVPGKKFFTFGNGPMGQMWDKILTDQDGPYVELMAGAYSDNQPDYSWIQPYEAKFVTEYWYPVREMGGVKNASRDAAVNLEVRGGMIHLAVNTTSAMDVTVLLAKGGQALLKETLRISPDRPFVKQTPLPAGAKAEELRLSVLSAQGLEIIAYQPARREDLPMPVPVVPPSEPQKVATNEELLLAGQRLEQFHSPSLEAEPYYLEALKRDADDIRANTALGTLYCRRFDFAKAQEYLARAAGRLRKNYTRPRDGEALYYLGLACRALGQREQAIDALHRAAWSFAWRCAAYYSLAEMAGEEGRWDAALDLVGQSLSFNANHVKALCLQATALRKLGQFAPAGLAVASALELDCLNFRALHEQALLGQACGQKDAAGQRAELSRLMRSQVQSYLELACEYQAVGLWDDALGVLEASLDEPMVLLGRGYCLDRLHQADAARRAFEAGCQMSPELCFPSRAESVAWLEKAMVVLPKAGRPYYYLGCLLYDRQPARAVKAWEKAVELGEKTSLVLRNLALAYARSDAGKARAVECLNEAIACNPADAKLYCDLDVLLEAVGADHAARLTKLQSNPSTRQRDDGLLREIILHNLVGNYDQAIELLAGRHFHIWEGGENSVHDVHVDARLLRGLRLLKAGQAQPALEDFQAAAEYPDRFEVGRPVDGGREAQVNYCIALALEALGQVAQAQAALRQCLAHDKKGTYLAYYQAQAARKLSQNVQADERLDSLAKVGREMLDKPAGMGFFDKFGHKQPRAVADAQGHFLIGLALLGKGDRTAAGAELAKAVELNPNHLWARALRAEWA